MQLEHVSGPTEFVREWWTRHRVTALGLAIACMSLLGGLKLADELRRLVIEAGEKGAIDLALRRGVIPSLDRIDDERLIEIGDDALDQAGELLTRGDVDAALGLILVSELLAFEVERRNEALERRLGERGTP